MPEFASLAKLICGTATADQTNTDCEISQILSHLGSVVVSTTTELQALSGADESRVALYGPFLARSLLEVGVTALIGRMDPTRLLVVKRVQEHGEYDTQKPWQSAIRWQGDVVDDKAEPLWAPKKLYKDMTKALLGDYYAEIYWAPALKRVSDANHNGGTWLAGIKSEPIKQFIATRRDSITKLYSESSKGVHSEFVVPPGSRYDKFTIIDLATKTLKLLSELGLLVNFLPHVTYKVSSDDAVALFNEIERIEVLA